MKYFTKTYWCAPERKSRWVWLVGTMIIFFVLEMIEDVLRWLL